MLGVLGCLVPMFDIRCFLLILQIYMFFGLRIFVMFRLYLVSLILFHILLSILGVVGFCHILIVFVVFLFCIVHRLFLFIVCCFGLGSLVLIGTFASWSSFGCLH